MTQITRNFDEFAQACIQNPLARVRVEGNSIVFLAHEGDKVKEGLKDFGRFLFGGFSLRNHHANNNYAVAQKLREWRDQEDVGSFWRGFGRDNLTKVIGNEPKEYLASIVSETRSKAPAADALRLLRRFERQVAVADRGFGPNVTFPEVAVTHRSILGSTESVNREIRNGSKVFSDDMSVTESMTDGVILKEQRDNEQGRPPVRSQGASPRGASPELNRSVTPPPVSKLDRAAGRNDEAHRLVAAYERVQDRIYDLNEAIKDGSAQYGVAGMDTDDANTFTYYNNLKAEYLQRTTDISHALEGVLERLRDAKPNEKAALHHEMAVYSAALKDAISARAIHNMQKTYWTAKGQLLPSTRIEIFVELERNKADKNDVEFSTKSAKKPDLSATLTAKSMVINNPPASAKAASRMSEAESEFLTDLENGGWDIAPPSEILAAKSAFPDLSVEADDLVNNGWALIGDEDVQAISNFTDGNGAASDSVDGLTSAQAQELARPRSLDEQREQAFRYAEGFSPNYLGVLSTEDLQMIHAKLEHFKNESPRISEVFNMVNGAIVERANRHSAPVHAAPTVTAAQPVLPKVTPKITGTITYEDQSFEIKTMADADLIQLGDRIHGDLKHMRNTVFSEGASKQLALVDKELRTRGLSATASLGFSDILNGHGDYSYLAGANAAVFDLEVKVRKAIEQELGLNFDQGNLQKAVPVRLRTVFDDLVSARTHITVQIDATDANTSDDPGIFQEWLEGLQRNADHFRDMLDALPAAEDAPDRKTYIKNEVSRNTIGSYIANYARIIHSLESRNEAVGYHQSMTAALDFVTKDASAAVDAVLGKA